MSHFTVIVVGDDHEKQLAPYHEFECTGVDDQYVVEVEEDVETYRKQYESATETMLRDVAGNLHSFFDDKGNWREEFSREEIQEPLGFKNRVKHVPEGYEEVEVPVSQLQSFDQWLAEYSGKQIIQIMNLPGAPTFEQQFDREGKHKYGYILTDHYGNVVKIVDRTNPQKKWDWYQVGGRWTGYFKLKPGANGAVGRPGIMTEPASAGWVDQAKLGDIDIEGMQRHAAQEAAARFDAVVAHLHSKLGESLTDSLLKQTNSWDTLVQTFNKDYDSARKAYNAQTIVQALKDCEATRFELRDTLAIYQLTNFVSINESRTKYISLACDSALVPFAVVKDGKWYERGSMGWWGAVSDEKDRNTWNHEFHKLLEGLPADTQLTAIDAHI